MSYVGERIIHDADSHVMELPNGLDAYMPKATLEAYHRLPGYIGKIDRGVRNLAWFEEARSRQADPEFRAAAESEIITRKGWDALGAFIPSDRSRALDIFGYASQLVFTTIALQNFELDHGDDMALCYELARAHNRMMVDFCAVDRRLLPTAYVPIADLERAPAAADEAISMGCKAIVIPSKPPRDHGPSHIALDRLWAKAQDAGLPILFHITGTYIAPSYKLNGRPPVTMVSADGDFNSVGFMGIPQPVMNTVAALIFDGVFDRFPKLKFGAIELGASWVPSWMRYMDAGFNSFFKHEERLRNLTLKPSEFVERQFRATPYPFEDTGWIISQAGDSVCMYSSDYPHPEGGRDPLKRFEGSLENASPHAVERFMRENFIDLMGEGLAEDLRRPKHPVAA